MDSKEKPDAKLSKAVFKVLSIDGGGIKGLYTAAMLAELEKALARKPGHSKLSEYFDFIAGTSTGALIACALAAGKTCQEILPAYRDLGPRIFRDINLAARRTRDIRQHFLGARYSNRELKSALSSLLGETRFSQVLNYLLVPVTNVTNYTPRIFKTRHSRFHTIDDCLLRDVALASAAAPTYFPLVDACDLGCVLYADGGLVANNPTMLSALEALLVFVGSASERQLFDQLAILSLGTYSSPKGLLTVPFTSQVVRSKSSLGWMLPQKGNLPLINILMDSQTALAETSVTYLQRSNPNVFVKYVRRDGKTGTTGKPRATPESKLLSFGLADAGPRAMNELEGFGKQDGQSDATDPNIKFFFDTVRSPINLMM